MEHRSIAGARDRLLLVISPSGTELAVLQVEGPQELARRRKALVWGDEVEFTTKFSKPRMKTAMKTVIPSKIARTALLRLALQSTPYRPLLPPTGPISQDQDSEDPSRVL